MNHMQDIIEAHPLHSVFNINLTKHRAGKVTLKLASRSPVLDMQLGLLGNIVDCAARLAGYAIFGGTFISECEMNTHAKMGDNELLVSATLSDVNREIAAFHCEIHSKVQCTKVLIAESHGTLVKSNPEPLLANTSQFTF